MADLNKKYINVPKINVPYTTIINRAKIPDLSKDLSVRMGVERYSIQSIHKVESEQGPAGESIYRSDTDELNLTSFVGNWTNFAGTSGPRAQMSNPDLTSYFEVHFYGTGLNLLTTLNTSVENHIVSIDGSAFGANIVAGTWSPIIDGRNVKDNQILNIASGLTQDKHTIIIKNNTLSEQLQVHGYEVLNESTQLTINQGEGVLNDAVINSLTQSNLPYNSGFESGVLGTKGGRVAVYQKIDGTIGHAVNPVGATQKNLALADHSNEEISRSYNFREFGAGRSDDFSTLTIFITNRSFTLEDGVTTLVGSNILQFNENLAIGNPNSEITLTFIGTGLDICRTDSVSGLETQTTWNISIDGTLVGTLDLQGSTLSRLVSICSGLPYGTHIIKFHITTSSLVYNVGIKDFIVYQPKTPTIPNNSQLLGTYNVLADYVANNVTGAGVWMSNIPQGVIRKMNTREFLYSGTWVVVLHNNYASGNYMYTTTNGGYVESIFFGTGFEFRYYSDLVSQTNTDTITIDGLVFNTANFPTQAALAGTSPTIGSFNAATGVLNHAVGVDLKTEKFHVSGLPLGKHTVRFTNGTVNQMHISALDIITPIYSPVQAIRNKQNAIEVGNNSIADHRSLSEFDNVIKKVNVVEAIGISQSPSTTSTIYTPIPDMFCVIKTDKASLLEIVFTFEPYSNSGTDYFSVYVNGKRIGSEHFTQNGGANLAQIAEFSDTVSVDKGTHLVQIFWHVGGGTLFLWSNRRKLTVKEL